MAPVILTPEQKRNDVGAGPGQHDAPVGDQRAVACPRDVCCGDVEDLMIESGFDPGTRLEFGRH